MLKYQFKEEVEHGTALFPICVYSVDFTGGPSQILPCHWHDESEIILISKGSAIFKIDDESFLVREGEALVINSGELHSGYTTDPEGCHYYAIVYKLSFLHESINDCSHKYLAPLAYKECRVDNIIGLTFPYTENLIALLWQIIDKYLTTSSGFELFIKGSLLIFYSILIEHGRLEPIQDERRKHVKFKSQQIKKTIQFVEDNYDKKISLEDMAAEVNMGRYKLCHMFKEYTGNTPFQYLCMYRIEKAAELLKKGFSVTEAALRTGFDSLSYFTKQFKKQKKILPSKY